MEKYLIYTFNVLIIALPLALFEISIEKSKGWGSGWSRDRWYAKPFKQKNSIVKSIVKILRIESPLNYHILVFAVILPLIFLAEYLYLINKAMLLSAIFVGVTVFEDFLWFLFNWYFDSLNQLLKGPNGSIWWHKGWVKISPRRYLPTSYFIGLAISLALLYFA